MRYLILIYLLLFNVSALAKDTDKVPYVDSEARQKHIRKIKTISLESLIENEHSMRLVRAVVCAATVVAIPFVAAGQIIPVVSFLNANVSHAIEKTYSPKDSGAQHVASMFGALDLIAGDGNTYLFVYYNSDTHFNDPVKAVFKAAFTPKDSNSSCARHTINLADVRLEILTRQSEETRDESSASRGRIAAETTNQVSRSQ